jgi:hypothetical protein
MSFIQVLSQPQHPVSSSANAKHLQCDLEEFNMLSLPVPGKHIPPS